MSNRKINTRVRVSALALLIFQAVCARSASAQDKADSTAVAESYRSLINAENLHDVRTVKSMPYDSPGTLLIAKTKTPAEGGWGGFWGTGVVGEHLEAIITTGTFQIHPDLSLLRVTSITNNVVELYAPVKIAVSYAGQSPVPKLFLMVIIWIKVNKVWKIQSDMVIPIPQT